MATFAGHWGPEVLVDSNGRPWALTAYTVLLAGTLTPATLYTSRTKATAQPNPGLVTSALGNASFWADPGYYDLLNVVTGTVVTNLFLANDPLEPAIIDAPAVGSVNDASIAPSGLSESKIANLVSDLAGKQATIPLGTYAKPATSGTLAARPAASVIGQRYLATDTNGGTLYESLDGSTWTQLAAAVGFQTLLAESVKTASYTLALVDAGTVVGMNVPIANTVTVPPDASVAFPIGSVLEVSQVGAGITKITPGVGVTVNPPTRLNLARYGAASVRKRAANEWVAVGELYLSDPSGISSLVAWFQADDIAQADASAIAAWADKATVPHNLAQATTSKQPTLRTNVLNGHAVARFTGSLQAGGPTCMVAAAGLVVPQPSTIFVVGKSSDLAQSGGQQRFVDGAGADSQQVVDMLTNVYAMYAGTSFVSNGSADTGFKIIAATFNGATSNMRTSGGAGAVGNAGVNTLNGLTVGASGSGGLKGLVGDIAEIAIYSAALSLGDMNAIGANLSARYALSWASAI